LAKFHDPQVQTACNQDHAVPDQNASGKAPCTVCPTFIYQAFPCPRPGPRRPKLVGIKKKTDRRETVRERKALAAAHLERSIEKELLERLKSKAYGDAPLNVNESVWTAILDKEKALERGEELEDEETEEEELEGEVEEEWEEREFVSDVSESEDELSDLEQITGGVDGSDYSEESGDDDDTDANEETGSKPVPKSKPKSKSTLGKRKAEFSSRKPKRGPRIEVEYENETVITPRTRIAASGW